MLTSLEYRKTAFNKIFKQLCSLRSRAAVIDKFRIPRNPVKHEIFHGKTAETLTVTQVHFGAVHDACYLFKINADSAAVMFWRPVDN